jgi:hypothetical protein
VSVIYPDYDNGRIEMTLVDLRKEALFVRVSHYRYVGERGKGMLLLSAVDIRINGLTHLMLAKGGMTRMQVVYKDGTVRNVASACSKKEAFNKKTGVSECLKRLAEPVEKV